MKKLLILAVFLSACHRNIQRPSVTEESGFVHAVYFYLNEDLSNEEKLFFKTVLDTLAQIPSIQRSYYGPPAMTPRKVVDNDYDFAWICVFKDKEGHDAYQEHPIHVDFKKRYTHMIRDVKIFDNFN
ncbi:MAG: Dabb family protein [Bacteroidia bacterium]|nr:Dabb family protein [Bacteroidia bacterium]